ncbi:MAG TPA: AAA family ATPase [Anaerovoracaceae bacterium]|nr:AAA family ATPase [Anaerovoracaceae bacterium]
MNIKEAKAQIVNAMTAYFTKDEFGCYRIPIEKQRPVFMIGPPGIGKTAIMEQVSAELGVGLVSYSMTHHTRQSALGLPYIVKEMFDDWEYDVSEYTMSEIIGSVYKLMRETGVREGILFLDEINCISETLAPCMLQFLQYKIFGQHRVPEGWIVVTAGNPPEYNKSVRDFDIVTWDRLKRIDVEPDYEAWKEYAYRKGVHASVMTYLAAKKKDFYRVESTVDGKSFVTARGWDDLSEMVYLYEENGLPVDEKLIGQYLQNKKIAKDFAIYYDLYNKYRSDYQIDSILAGTASDFIVFRAQNAKFDERLSLIGLLFAAITAELREVTETEDMMSSLLTVLKEVRVEMEGATDGKDGADGAAEVLERQIGRRRAALENGIKASSISTANQRIARRVIAALEEYRAALLKEGVKGNTEAFHGIKAAFESAVARLQEAADAVGKRLDHLFGFCETAFADGQEMLLLVTEMTANYYSARFIGHYGCDQYFAHNKELQFHERQREILTRIEQLNWLI